MEKIYEKHINRNDEYFQERTFEYESLEKYIEMLKNRKKYEHSEIIDCEYSGCTLGKADEVLSINKINDNEYFIEKINYKYEDIDIILKRIS